MTDKMRLMQEQPPPARRRHLEFIFRGLRHTLLNRGLYRKLKHGGIQKVAWKRTFLVSELGVVAFEVDVQRLSVKIEHLLEPEVSHQIQACLGGRKVWPVNSSSLVFCIKLEPEEPKERVRLPRRVPLDLDARPKGKRDGSGVAVGAGVCADTEIAVSSTSSRTRRIAISGLRFATLFHLHVIMIHARFPPEALDWLAAWAFGFCGCSELLTFIIYTV